MCLWLCGETADEPADTQPPTYTCDCSEAEKRVIDASIALVMAVTARDGVAEATAAFLETTKAGNVFGLPAATALDVVRPEAFARYLCTSCLNDIHISTAQLLTYCTPCPDFE